MRFLAVLCVRNEAAFLLEWLAHHQAVGFTDFLVFSNDCQDGTDAMLDRLEALGQVAHVRNDGPYDQRGIQFTALKAAEKHPLVTQVDWILTFDVDEFVNIHLGDRTLPALLAALPDATAITLTWRLFGNAGVVRYEDKSIIEQFRQAAPLDMLWPWRAAMFKTLYRNDGTYGKLGVHRPRQPDRDRLPGARWYDGEGRVLPEQFKTQRLFSDFGRSNHKLVQLNHYALGAMESFVLKADRGRINRSDKPLDMDYWVERNFNQCEDKSIDALADQRDARMAALRSDPHLNDLHEAAVGWRMARFDALMKDDEPRALFGRLLMTPPSQSVPAEAARFMAGYAVRSHAKMVE